MFGHASGELKDWGAVQKPVRELCQHAHMRPKKGKHIYIVLPLIVRAKCIQDAFKNRTEVFLHAPALSPVRLRLPI